MEKSIFNELLKELDIELTEKKYNQLYEYYKLLVEWNSKINLTSITEEKQVFIKHFYDSLSINKIIDLSTAKTLCDIGTGAGFPGIVIKIIFPNIHVTLVDSLTKRIKFLEVVKEQLNLNDLDIINSRAEIYSKNTREKFDIVTSRAVAKLNVLLELGFSAVKENGYFIAMKSSNANEELDLSRNALKELDGKVEKIENLNLPLVNEPRTLIKILKTRKTKEKYPREFKQISKNAL